MLKIAMPLLQEASSTKYYLEALTNCGAEPVLGTDIHPEACDGLLLPGGVDVTPSLYGQEPIPATVPDPALDDLQLGVLRRFLELRKPIFGICRGHQLLNVALGGTLIQDLPTARDHLSLPEGDQVHPVEAVPGSWIAGLYGTFFSVNSFHHQGVDRPGEGFRVALRAADGVIEAMEHETLPIWTVQFHPERMCFSRRREDTVDGSLLIRFFLEKCECAGK